MQSVESDTHNALIQNRVLEKKKEWIQRRRETNQEMTQGSLYLGGHHIHCLQVVLLVLEVLLAQYLPSLLSTLENRRVRRSLVIEGNSLTKNSQSYLDDPSLLEALVALSLPRALWGPSLVDSTHKR